MSKLLSRVLALVLAVSLTGMGLVVSHSKTSRAQRPGAARHLDRNQTVIATTAEVLKETSKLRELPVLRPVRSGAQSRQEIERMLVSKLNQEVSRQEIHAIEQSLKKFGFVQSDFAYRPFIVGLLTEQVAGYYDPAARRFHLADWIDLDAQKPVMAHELTHALQDQHFNLRRFENWPRGDSDAQLAAHSLIEGDATLTMTHYLFKHPLLAAEFMRTFNSGSVSSEKFDKAPRSLRETLLFPYLQGIAWATQVHQRGGFSALSKAYSQLPESTEQILHAEKYFNRESPRTVRLSNFTNLLEGSKPQIATTRRRGKTTNPRSAIRNLKSPGWRQIETDVNGEWGYYLALDEFLKSPAESKRAAAGWGGDKYALYEHSTTGDLFLVQVALWDTVEDAKEFFDAYVKRTALRYPEATQEDKNASTETIRRWQTREGGVLIELRGTRVVILEGVPGNVSARDLASYIR
ncbi:MAG TPA: hypothetical protein VJU84_04305 [Pyrinomonadaceae bacterium]|nr:hypothetical protein [Pyrinomonadaceae bacterium]